MAQEGDKRRKTPASLNIDGLVWWPLSFAAGIALYFALPQVLPGTFFMVAAVVFLALTYILTRAHPVGLIALHLALFSLGYADAAWRAESVRAPKLERETNGVQLNASIEEIARRENGHLRLLLHELQTEDRRLAPVPKRIRITVRTTYGDIRPGDRISLRVNLLPPPEPVAPGAHDFARVNWFSGIGAGGYAISPVTLVSRPQSPGWRARLETIRDQVTTRIRTVLPGETGGLAAAFLTGRRDGMTEETVQAMRDAGLAHLLAISGLHMGLVTGILFFTVRSLLVFVPGLALRYDLKRVAAIVSWLGGLAYLGLSGATVPTIRAFLSVSIVLLGVLVGRRAISMRLVAIAALTILGLWPELLLSVSFQMSFAAVIALVAVYEGRGVTLLASRRYHETWGGRVSGYVLAVAVTTVVASLATAPFSAYHFGRVSVFGNLSNLVAVPAMGMLVMPLGLLALLLMPFGMDAPVLQLMGFGLELIIATAKQTAALPIAVWHVPAFPATTLVVLCVAGLAAALFRGRGRLAGLGLALLAPLTLIGNAPPDILVDRDGKLVAGLMSDGRLAVTSGRSARYARERWAERAGGATVITLTNLAKEAKGSRRETGGCGPEGCLMVLDRRGTLVRVATVYTADAFLEDCRSSDIVVNLSSYTGPCPIDGATIIRAGPATGAQAIWITQDGLRIETVNEARGHKPWTGSP